MRNNEDFKITLQLYWLLNSEPNMLRQSNMDFVSTKKQKMDNWDHSKVEAFDEILNVEISNILTKHRSR